MIEIYGNTKFMKLLKPNSDILELGNQIMNLEHLQGVPAKQYYTNFGHTHTSVDLNGKDGALVKDLTEEFYLGKQFDYVTDFGTIEHVGTPSDFKSLYNALNNVYQHCKIGGYMLHKNPMKGSFHDVYHDGCYHFTCDFWNNYAKILNCEIEVEEYPIYGNTKDGWEIFAVLKKTSDKFMTFTEFKKLTKYIYDK